MLFASFRTGKLCPSLPHSTRTEIDGDEVENGLCIPDEFQKIKTSHQGTVLLFLSLPPLLWMHRCRRPKTKTSKGEGPQSINKFRQRIKVTTSRRPRNMAQSVCKVNFFHRVQVCREFENRHIVCTCSRNFSACPLFCRPFSQLLSLGHWVQQFITPRPCCGYLGVFGSTG